VLIEPERLATCAHVDGDLSALATVQRPVGHVLSAIGARHGWRF
jgi:hypothetical protein